MGCTCNAICDADCGSNELTSGRVEECSSNEFPFSWTPIAGTTIILAQHLRDLESAINNERVNTNRRFTSPDPADCTSHIPGDVACNINTFAAWVFSGGLQNDIIDKHHWEDVKDANNDVSGKSGWGGQITTDFKSQVFDPVNSVILASDIIDLQTKINQTRTVCICDTHCNCHPTDCGCNGECPSHYYYYYP